MKHLVTKEGFFSNRKGDFTVAYPLGIKGLRFHKDEIKPEINDVYYHDTKLGWFDTKKVEFTDALYKNGIGHLSSSSVDGLMKELKKRILNWIKDEAEDKEPLHDMKRAEYRKILSKYISKEYIEYAIDDLMNM